MTKHSDDRHEAVDRSVMGATVPDEPPPERSYRIPGRVDQAGLDDLTRAVTLKLSTLCVLGKITPEIFGKALTSIAREWISTEMGHMSGADKDD